ncbi:MAG: efflux RND transporter permease subunit, partial [Dehalococcoidia bacterium]
VIALGAVIDNAIIDVDKVVRRLGQQAAEGGESRTAALILEAIYEIRSAIIFAALITLLVVVPLFFLQGLSGALLQSMAIAYGAAVIASLVVALTFTPVLSVILFSLGSPPRRESPVVRYLRQGYDAVLARLLRTRHPVYLTVIVAGVVAIGGTVLLPQLLTPTINENDLLIQWRDSAGTSRKEMNRTMTQVSNELRSLPGVVNVNVQIGRAVESDQIVDVNTGEIWVSVDPTADYDATVNAMEQVIEGYPGLSQGVETYLDRRFQETMAGTRDDVVVRIFGQDPEVLRSKAEEIRDGLARIPGIVNPQVETQIEAPQVEIEVNLEAAQRHGVKPGDVRRAAATLVSGLEVGNLFEEQKVFDVVVWGVPETRDSVSDIRELLIDTPSGDHIRLHQVADVRIEPALDVIKREAVQRRVNVSAEVQGRSLGSVNRDVEALIQGVDFPIEHHAALVGESMERQDTQRRLLILGLSALVGVFFLLQAAFGSWRLALLASVTLPAALLGGVVAIWVDGGVIQLGSLAGLLLVLGVGVRNGVIQIRHYQRLQWVDGGEFCTELVRRGAGERLGPILATAAVTGLAL